MKLPANPLARVSKVEVRGKQVREARALIQCLGSRGLREV